MSLSGVKRERPEGEDDGREPGEVKRPRLDDSGALPWMTFEIIDLGIVPVAERKPPAAVVDVSSASGSTGPRARKARPSDKMVDPLQDDSGDEKSSVFDSKNSSAESSSSSSEEGEVVVSDHDEPAEPEPEPDEEEEEIPEAFKPSDEEEVEQYDDDEEEDDDEDEDVEYCTRVTKISVPAGGMLAAAVESAFHDAADHYDAHDGDGSRLSLLVRYLRGIPLTEAEMAPLPKSLLIYTEKLPDRGVTFTFAPAKVGKLGRQQHSQGWLFAAPACVLDDEVFSYQQAKQ
jgi:hypothetical protein